jgi:CubicO group peptidase (beta-lactamase class C family)
VVRRITGTSIGQFFTDEIAGPLGADFQIGLPEMDFPRAPASSLAISLGPPREQG